MTAALRVGVYLADQNPHRDRSQGITVMTESILERVRQRPEVSVTSLVSSSSVRWRDAGTERRVPWRTDGLVGRLAVDAVHPLWQRSADVDVWWYPKGYCSSIARGGTPTVGEVPDAILAHYATYHPDTRSRLDLAYWMRQLRRSLRHHDRVCTLSADARRQLLEVCDSSGIDAPEIGVVGCGSEWELHRRRPRPLDARPDQVVHLASRAPHKRTNELLGSWRTLERAGRDLPMLVLVGSVDDEGEQLLSGLSSVRRSGWVDVDQLRELFEASSALLLPSAIEGFGLPALEAGYMGTPVLFRPGTAVEEVVGPLGAWGAVDFASPDDVFDAVGRAADVTVTELDRWGDDLYERFALERVTDRLLAELRAAVR